MFLSHFSPYELHFAAGIEERFSEWEPCISVFLCVPVQGSPSCLGGHIDRHLSCGLDPQTLLSKTKIDSEIKHKNPEDLQLEPQDMSSDIPNATCVIHQVLYSLSTYCICSKESSLSLLLEKGLSATLKVTVFQTFWSLATW
jgi:hypothetical protein